MRQICPSLARQISFLESYLLSFFSYYLMSASMFRFGFASGLLVGLSTEKLRGKLNSLLSSLRPLSLFTLSFCRKRMRSASQREGYEPSSSNDDLLSALMLFSCFICRPLPPSAASLYFFLIASALCPSAWSAILCSWKTWLCLITSESIISLLSLANKWSSVGWDSLEALSSRWVERSEYSVLKRALLLVMMELEGLTSSLSLLIMRWILQLRSSMLDAFSCSKCLSFSALRNYSLPSCLPTLSVGRADSQQEGGRVAFPLPLHSSLRSEFSLPRRPLSSHSLGKQDPLRVLARLSRQSVRGQLVSLPFILILNLLIKQHLALNCQRLSIIHGKPVAALQSA